MSASYRQCLFQCLDLVRPVTKLMTQVRVSILHGRDISGELFE